MAVDPTKIQSVLTKATDEQLMAMLKRPDSIPSMFVQQEIRRRNMARQAAKADLAKLNNAQKPQIPPQMTQAVPMNTGGSGRLAEQKRALMQMFNAGRYNIVRGVAENDQGELGQFARELLSANQMRPTDNKGLDISRKPQFTDFDMTDPKNNFPGSRLNYSIAPMIQQKNTEFSDAKAREKELANQKSEFLNALENVGIKSVKDQGDVGFATDDSLYTDKNRRWTPEMMDLASEKQRAMKRNTPEDPYERTELPSSITPMNLENEYLEGQFNPEGKFDYGVAQGYKPFMPNAAGREDIYLDTPLNTFPFGRTGRGEGVSASIDVDPRMRTNTIGFDPRTNIGEYGFPPNYVEKRTPSPFVSKGGLSDFVEQKIKEDDAEVDGIPLLKEHMSRLEDQLKAQEVEDEKNKINIMDLYGQAMGMIGNQTEFDNEGNLIVKQPKFEPNKYIIRKDNEKINVPINTEAFDPENLRLEKPALTVENIKKGIHTLGGIFPQQQYYEKPLGYESQEKYEEASNANRAAYSGSVGTNRDINKDNTVTENKDSKPTKKWDQSDRAEVDPPSFIDMKKSSNNENLDDINKDVKDLSGAKKVAGTQMASEMSKLTDAQNRLIEAMKPAGDASDRFWELVANFGARIWASDKPNLMQATGEAMQQTLAEHKELKGERRDQFIAQAKMAVDLEFQRANLGLQLARLGATSGNAAASLAFRKKELESLEDYRDSQISISEKELGLKEGRLKQDRIDSIVKASESADDPQAFLKANLPELFKEDLNPDGI